MIGNYSKTFYPQSGGLDARVDFTVDSNELFLFGFSGNDSGLQFSGLQGLLYDISGRVIGTANSKKNFFEVYSNDGFGSLYCNGRLVDSINLTDVAVSSVYSQSSSDYNFDFEIYGSAPILSGMGMDWNSGGTGTGQFFWYGEHPLKITDLTIEDRMDFQVDTFPSLATSGINEFTVLGSGGNYPSGHFRINLDTDAGFYQTMVSHYVPLVLTGGIVKLYTDSSLSSVNKTGAVNFFVQNNLPSDQDFSISFVEESGVTSGIHFVTASGFGLIEDQSFVYNGPKRVEGNFSGTLTGQGGRTGEIKTISFVESGVGFYHPTGIDSREVGVPASGIVDSLLYYGVFYVSGYATGSGGYYNYNFINETGVPLSATSYNGSSTITPLPTDIFTGSSTQSIPISGSFSGDVPVYFESGTFVDEGSGNFVDIWGFEYDGNDFVTSGWTGYQNIGTGSPTFTLTSGETKSGVISFSTDFSGKNRYDGKLTVNTSSLTVFTYV